MHSLFVRFSLSLALLAPAFAACGGDDHDHDPADPAADACEHMIEGPAEQVVAASDLEAGDAPETTGSHKRLDVELAEFEGQRGGYVDYLVAEAGELHLFLDADASLTLLDAAGTEIAAEATMTAVDDCAEVGWGAVYDVAVGTYTLELGPVDATTARVVPVAGGDEHHE